MTTFKMKMNFVIFLLVAVSFFNSCQGTKAVHNEDDRQQHAKEILTESYSKSVAARFEKDLLLASYVEEYLRKNGRELASREVARALIEVSRQNQYDPIFLMAIIKTESQFKPNTIGSAGEIGLMQIKPTTAQWICEKKGIKWRGDSYLKDPHYNIEVGALYFKYLKKSLKSKAALYITAYNTGINNLNRSPASERKTSAYFTKVLNNYLGIYKDLEKIKSLRKTS